MNFNFKKIASVMSSAVMVSSTVALAAAANFPAPYVQSGAADVAVVYGASAATTDLIAAVDIQSALSTELASQTASGGGTSGASITGEAYALFTSSSKIYINDSLNKARSLVTDSHLPNILADGTFEGDVSATYEQKIDISSNAQLVLGQHPTSDDDPIITLKVGTTASAHIYNLTITFNKAVNFTHADSQGESFMMFGQEVTVGSATDATNLVLLKSSTKIDLSSDDPTAEVTIDGETYTIEQISTSDSAATIKVTDSDGESSSKEINQDASKTIQGIEVAVIAADETNLKLSSTILVGADRLKFTDNAAIKVGSSEDTLDGTNVRFGADGGQKLSSNLTKIVIQISAEDTDVDAILRGEPFIDPVFGNLKIDFADVTIPEDSDARETFVIKNSGSDKMTINFASHESGGESKLIDWYYNKTAAAKLADSGGDGINVFEMAQINKTEYVIVGNEDS